jgi:lysozyme
MTNRNEPKSAPATAKERTLVGIVGLVTAALLVVSIPADESGRKVDATVKVDGSITLRHVSGKQHLKAYLDIVGVGTACDGITRYGGKPIRAGQTFTEAQCTEMLEHELIVHAEGVMRCTPGLALTRGPRADGPRFAAVSLAYNVGVGNYCSSTARRRFNARDYAGGCDALLMWNKAGGKVVRGLTLRRERERAVCKRTL